MSNRSRRSFPVFRTRASSRRGWILARSGKPSRAATTSPSRGAWTGSPQAVALAGRHADQQGPQAAGGVVAASPIGIEADEVERVALRQHVGPVARDLAPGRVHRHPLAAQGKADNERPLELGRRPGNTDGWDHGLVPRGGAAHRRGPWRVRSASARRNEIVGCPVAANEGAERRDPRHGPGCDADPGRLSSAGCCG